MNFTWSFLGICFFVWSGISAHAEGEQNPDAPQEIEIQLPAKKTTHSFSCKVNPDKNLVLKLTPFKEGETPMLRAEFTMKGVQYKSEIEKWHYLTGLTKKFSFKEGTEQQGQVVGNIDKISKFKVGDRFSGTVNSTFTDSKGKTRSLTRVVTAEIVGGAVHSFKNKKYPTVSVRVRNTIQETGVTAESRYDYSPELGVIVFFETTIGTQPTEVCRLVSLSP